MTLCCVLGQDTLFYQCLSPPRFIDGYQRIKYWGVSLQWTSISSRGSRNTSSRFMLQKPHMSAPMMGHLARMQTLPFTLFSENFLFKVKHKVNFGQYKMQTADDQSKFLGHVLTPVY